ncbi:MAG: hypothetical protein QNJ81_10965 [Acidimicrobiia bacterium]|nr:hypothetical protein [Acidimicrobiia bacterium]
MGKGRRRVTTVAVVAAVLFASAGLVYAHWTTTTTIQGNVNTGNVDTFWTEWSCTDTGMSADLTALPIGVPAPQAWIDLGTGFAPPGFQNPFQIWQTTEDVAQTHIDAPPGLGVTTVVFRIDNAYPSHYEDCEWGFGNIGSIPLAAPYVVVRALNPETTFASTIFAEDGALWIDFSNGFPVAQINPEQSERGSFRIHVEQTADQNDSYAFEISVCTHNWNEPSTAADDICGLYDPQEVVDGTVFVIPGI